MFTVTMTFDLGTQMLGYACHVVMVVICGMLQWISYTYRSFSSESHMKIASTVIVTLTLDLDNQLLGSAYCLVMLIICTN